MTLIYNHAWDIYVEKVSKPGFPTRQKHNPCISQEFFNWVFRKPKKHRITIISAHDASMAYLYSLCCIDLLTHHSDPQQPLNSDIVSPIGGTFDTACCLQSPD